MAIIILGVAESKMPSQLDMVNRGNVFWREKVGQRCERLLSTFVTKADAEGVGGVEVSDGFNVAEVNEYQSCVQRSGDVKLLLLTRLGKQVVRSTTRSLATSPIRECVALVPAFPFQW